MKTIYICIKCCPHLPCRIEQSNHRGIFVDIAEVVKKTCISNNCVQPNQDAEFERELP